MKRATILLVLACGTLHAQFEGVVESRNLTIDETGLQQEFTMTMYVKDAMARVSNSAIGSSPPVTMIYRQDLNVIWMINDEERSYYEVSRADEPADYGVPGNGDEKAVIRKTKRTRKILGYSCEQFLVRRSDAETEIWGSRKLAGLARSLARALGQERTGQQEAAWNDELTRMGVFPLAATTRIGGQVVEMQEVTRIEPRSLSDDLFSLPEGYRKQSVGELLK
ncbi:MAG: DUF4412 domain-containing protein [Bacteroidota bacterium]